MGKGAVLGDVIIYSVLFNFLFYLTNKLYFIKVKIFHPQRTIDHI